MQFCYVLTSSSWTEYTQMAYLSASSLRRIHPEAKIVLLTDELTVKSLSGDIVDHLQTVFNEIRPCPVRGESEKERSRALKTTIVKWVSGDCIFLDTDTLVVGRLDDLWNLNASLAIAPETDLNNYPKWAAPTFEKMRWSYPPKRSYNTGVILIRNCPVIHQFFSMWNDRWQAQVKATGILRDQEAFDSCINDMPFAPYPLSAKYNYLVKFRPKLSGDLRILHFFATSERFRGLWIFDALLMQVALRQPIDWTLLDCCLHDHHPWANPQPYLLIHSGNYFQALRKKMLKIFGI